jgi:hypothetical protein
MTPKEKARDLIIKFAFKGAQHEGEAKTFALIAVDEILKIELQEVYQNSYYWQEVKKEIEKL